MTHVKEESRPLLFIPRTVARRSDLTTANAICLITESDLAAMRSNPLPVPTAASEPAINKRNGKMRDLKKAELKKVYGAGFNGSKSRNSYSRSSKSRNSKSRNSHSKRDY